jgi:tetratricopeptide (TPR) repeat protein
MIRQSMIRRTFAVALFALAVATSAMASWYDDYDDGLAAIKKGNWNLAVQKMSAAIKGNPKEGDRVRTYGTILINYHPYYYRGVAYLNTGRYEEAVSDFERTSGPGPDNYGSLDTLMDRAKKQLAASNAAPEPEPARPEPARPTQPVVTQPAPAPAQPVIPQIDPSLRQRAAAALSTARQKIQAAQQRRATTSPHYAQASNMFGDATSRNATARTNDDLNGVISMADSAADLADLAMPPATPVIASTTTQSPLNPPPVIPKPAAVTTTIMQEADYSADVKQALESYFNAEFEDAARQFEELARKMPNNGWIHAFLGASQYSIYAFENDERYKREALRSFERAKQLRKWPGGVLPEKYFSRRIRKAFEEEG